MRRAAAVWERYPLGGRPGHEAEYQDEQRAGAARERKHRAAARRRRQHHGSDILRYPESKGVTGGDRGSSSWRREGEREQTIIRQTAQSPQRTWGGSAYFKGTHRLSAVSPVRYGGQGVQSSASAPGRDCAWRKDSRSSPWAASMRNQRPVVKLLLNSPWPHSERGE